MFVDRRGYRNVVDHGRKAADLLMGHRWKLWFSLFVQYIHNEPLGYIGNSLRLKFGELHELIVCPPNRLYGDRSLVAVGNDTNLRLGGV
jgi:hypothetical protein